MLIEYLTSQIRSVFFRGLNKKMQLNITTDYAIRSMIYLSMHDERVSSIEIAETMCIPDHYLYSVMGKLKKAGLVLATRGVNGGWVLSETPDKIKLIDIINAIEGTIKLNKCLADESGCSRGAANNCQLHDFYLEIQEQLEMYFASVTLAELRDRSWTPIKELSK